MQTLEQRPITVTYRSGTHPTQGWDAMQVIYSQDGRIVNHFLIARDAAGTIVRKTDIVLDRWEIITDADDLRDFQKCFDDRDRLAREQCQCGHCFSVHNRDARAANAMKVDDALLPARGYDIFSDRPVAESGCAECCCRQYKPTG
ncbi:MAG: hypothetical protein WAK78_11280 [Candidatus Acidiferrales bacterium]